MITVVEHLRDILSGKFTPVTAWLRRGIWFFSVHGLQRYVVTALCSMMLAQRSYLFYLKKLAVDFLEIDGMFGCDRVNDSVVRSMEKGINKIGPAKGLETIAQLVESGGFRR